MKEGTIKNILDAVRDWVNNKEQAYKPGEIYESVPNEIIKMLWDGKITFDELLPVSGANGLDPVDTYDNYMHFLRIFYTIDDLKQNAVTFTNNGESDFVFKFRFYSGAYDEQFPKLFLITDDLEELEYRSDPSQESIFYTDDITVAPGESAYIIGYNPKGFLGWDGDGGKFIETSSRGTDVTLSGNLMSLIDMRGSSKVIPNNGRFMYFFSEIYSLKDARDFKLPATTLTDSCYSGMFYGCYNLMSVPSLPATTLTENCYGAMFKECASLTSVPKNYLPATVLAYGCYSNMFDSCTNLTSAPVLPATTLYEECYRNMFSYCDFLVEAPKLPATELAETCYMSMFEGCTSLSKAPELPSLVLAENCYEKMFYRCTSLTEAPILPAKILKRHCYNGMFIFCRSLSHVICLAEDISADQCTPGWLSNVSPVGTFTMNPQAVWSRGDSGIPTGWNVEFEEKDAPFVMVKAVGGDVTTVEVASLGYDQELEISQDERRTWSSTTVGETYVIAPDQALYVRGILSGDNDLDDGNYTHLQIYGGEAELYGNVNAIWDYRNLNAPMKVECGISLFSGSSAIVKAPALPSTNLSPGCYAYMFQNCTNLKQAPELPSTELAGLAYGSYGCYAFMFRNCTSLTEAPELMAPYLYEKCYEEMFRGCTNLHWVKCMAEDWDADEGKSVAEWLTDTATYGVFIMSENAYNNDFWEGYIPEDWTTDFPYNYLRIRSIGDDNYIRFSFIDDNNFFSKCPYDLEYSYDTEEWYKYNFEDIYLDDGESIFFRGDNNTPFSIDSDQNYSGLHFYSPNGCDIWGDLTTLINKEGCIKDLRTVLTDRSFIPETIINSVQCGAFGCGIKSLFSSSMIVYNDMRLPSIYLSDNCYQKLFSGCIYQSDPYTYMLPAFDLASNCYMEMFYHNNNIKYPPYLPAPELIDRCYENMFCACVGLGEIHCYATRNINDFNTHDWTQGVPNDSGSGNAFYCNSGTSNTWSRGDSGIPSNWNVHEESPRGPY